MNKEKVFIEGYEVGFLSGTDGTREKKIQVASGEIVSIDENFIYKTIESQKVKVPQFVAEHIEWAKGEDYHLFGAMNRENFDKKLDDWFYIDDNIELFACAWIFGYTIEEKRYRVKMKAIKSNSQYLVFGQLSETWRFGSAEQTGNVKSEHTHKEIEDAGFGEVFNSPLFEVEEVEE